MRPFLVPVVLVLICVAVSQESTQPPIEVPPESVRDLLTTKVAPIYPPLARQARIQGTVVLKVIITKSGEVGKVQLVSGHPMLAPSAIAAVQQWRYQPYTANGEAVDITTILRVSFALGQTPHASGTSSGVEADASRSQGPAEPMRVRVSRGVMETLSLSKVSPQYPIDAREQHIEGSILLQVEIDRRGNVYDVQLISGHPLLAPAAVDAVKQWKYRPYRLNGEPVEVETQVLVNFTLTE